MCNTGKKKGIFLPCVDLIWLKGICVLEEQNSGLAEISVFSSCLLFCLIAILILLEVKQFIYSWLDWFVLQ